MVGSPPGSSIHGILQARVLERVAIGTSYKVYYFIKKDNQPILKGVFFFFWLIYPFGLSYKIVV